MRPPKVGIGVPVYNGARYLREALDGLLAQTFGEYEIVICDNASTDSTAEICNEYARHDRRVRVYRNPVNVGAPRNYNRVFELSRGEYFKWVAADDVTHPRFLEACVEVLDAQPDAVLAYPGTQIIDEAGEVLRCEPDPIKPVMDDPLERFDNVQSSLRECNAVFGLIRHAVLARTQLISSYFGADGHLLAELALHGKLVAIEGNLFYRREHPQASSYDKSVALQIAFWEPGRKERPPNTHLRALRADLRSILRAPLSLSQKIQATARRLRRAWWGKGNLWAEALDTLAYSARRFLSIARRLAGNSEP